MMSCTSVDLPDPLTPVITVSVLSGISTSMSRRLCSGRAIHPDALPGPAEPDRRHRNRQLAPQVLGGQRPRLVHEALEAAAVDHAPALLAGAQPEVDDMVGDADHVGVVLDDDHRVALIAQLPEDVDEAPVVAGVQADRRLVEHVERADQRRPERRRQVDALRLAARERRREPVERQVIEPDIPQERRAAAGFRRAACRPPPRPSRRAPGPRRSAPPLSP